MNCLDSLSMLFEMPVEDKIVYVLDTNNISLISRFGFIHHAFFYTNKGGRYIKDQHLIMDSFNECDEHEMVHYFTVIKYPDKIQFFDEGLATWLGGSMGKDLNHHVKKLYDYFYLMKTDTTGIMQLPRLDEETDPAYILGGVIIRYTVETFGIQKAVNLLSYSYKQYTPEEVIEKELGIPNDKLNTFLLDYVKKHGSSP